MQKELLGIVVGGGPAPGINGVISSATIEAVNEGIDVVGVVGGFKTLFEGRENDIRPLTINEVSRLHTHGGSILRTSRDYPDNVQEKFRVLMSTIRRLGIDYLITIGGEGTLFMANWINKEAQGSVKVVHVPKTIDNDIPLPGGLSTFGYQTARHLGVHIVSNLMEDARTTGRWYFTTTMGRHAGHLALGIGKAAGATITLIPEEFEEEVSINAVADILTGSIIKRLCMGRDHGVAILGEGISEKVIFDDADSYNDVATKDDMGRIRLSEIPLGEALKRICRKTLESLGLKVTIVDKNIGYELRAAAPIPFDVEYTRNLGYGAVRFLLSGQTGSTIIADAHDIQPVPFSHFIDELGNSKVRKVDINSQIYRVAREYMIRLEESDFEGKQLRRLAEAAHLEPDQFKDRFARAVL
ncbi:MAG: 6-phosphofructokinase 1 [Syntrophorhabdaceae bacterium PtaU1.Bin034]|jgi:6-phosphofructokinase 1|nr:MAG: 6-phosphofructokinase 1 [Syntrophorhabdaceae bacterium PtaU1.Bin034]